jgi:hypothetical protein
LRVAVRTLDSSEMPAQFKDAGHPYCYEVTSYDGTLSYFTTGAEAARHANALYKVHRTMLGLEDDRDF